MKGKQRTLKRKDTKSDVGATPARSPTAAETGAGVVTTYKSSRKAGQNSPGRSWPEAAIRASCCARANRAGASANLSPWRMRRHTSASSHHKYSDCRVAPSPSWILTKELSSQAQCLEGHSLHGPRRRLLEQEMTSPSISTPGIPSIPPTG